MHPSPKRRPTSRATAAAIALLLSAVTSHAGGVPEIAAAIRAGNSASALSLLGDETPVGTPVSRDGTTLLHLAARAGMADVVTALLDHGAPAAARDRDGRSALHHLADGRKFSRAALTELLGTPELVVDDLDARGRTPLLVAVERADLPAATALFISGADPRAADSKGQSPHSLAERKRRSEFLRLFAPPRRETPPPPPPPTPPGDDRYRAPDLAAPLLSTDDLSLPQAQRQELVGGLVALARNYSSSPLVRPPLRARAIALALAFDRRHRPAVVAEAQWRLGVRPAPVPDAPNLLQLATSLRRTAATLNSPQATREDRHLASLLIDIATPIDPTAPQAVATAPPDWRGAVPSTSPPPPAPPLPPATTTPLSAAPPLAVAASSIRSVLPRNGDAGTVLTLVDLTSTVLLRPPHATTTAARFTAPVGNPLAPALAGARRVVPWKRGYGVTLAVPPTTDPTPAGLAAAILVSSHFGGRPLDSTVAAIGSVTADGELVLRRDPEPLLRAAAAAGCKTVIVPASAVPLLTDAVALGATDLARDLQVYAAPDLATALAIASAAPPYADASAEFLLIQAQVAAGRLSSTAAVSRLRKVAATAPANLSARLLVAVATGTLPTQLSRTTSAKKVTGLANFITSKVTGRRPHPLPGLYTADELAQVRSVLTRQRSRLAPDVRPAADAVVDLALLLEKYIDTPPRSNDGRQKMMVALRAATDKMKAEIAKVQKPAG